MRRLRKSQGSYKGKIRRLDQLLWGQTKRESMVTPTSELFKKWWKQWQFVGKSFGKMCRFSCQVVDSFWVLFSFRGKMCEFLYDNQNILKWAACLVYSFNTYIRKINSVVWHLVQLSLIWNIHLWIIRRTTMDFFHLYPYCHMLCAKIQWFSFP